MDVYAFQLLLAPRDVHCEHGVWTVNQKAETNAEVVIGKMSASEKQQIERAMRKEIDPFISSEAVQVCE